MQNSVIQEVATRIAKEMADQGQIVESGYRAYEILCKLENVSAVQKKETRQAFFAGAQHLWGSMLAVMEPGLEPTEKDLKRMSMLDAELTKWTEEMNERYGKSGFAA